MNNEDMFVLDKIISKNFIGVKKCIYLFIKRLFDILISLIGLFILVPISFIVKICYLVNGDFDSIFFVQNRIGKDGKIFKLYKFRTMVMNADDILEQLLLNNENISLEYELNKKLKNDPRITKIGKFLRKSSLDELPQMINVFLGDMSLIGNRPYLPREKKDMGKYYEDIIITRPGLTGYWQVSGRSNTTFNKRLKLEKHYSINNGLKLDLEIFFKTFKVVLFGKDAM